MKKILTSILVLAVVGLIAVVGFQNSQNLYGSVLRFTYPEPLNNNEIREVIENGTYWLKNDQESSGHFKYEYMPFLDRYTDSDNMVRQTGVLYVLGEVYAKDIEDKFNLRDSIIKAVSYFEKNTIDGELNGKEFKCILKYKGRCTLGGTSLALIGILDLVEKNNSYNSKYEDLIEGYKEYILAMRVPSKGFRDSYFTEREQSVSESAFSDGEAFLALARYYLYKPDEEVKNTIDDIYKYFEKIYRKKWDNNFYLWGMAALKTLYKLDPKEEYYNFVKDYTDWRISNYKNYRGTIRNRCAYVEGITSAYSIIEPNLSVEEKGRYTEEIEFWLAKSEQLQVEEDDFLRMSFNYNFITRVNIENKDKATGGFLTASVEPVQRIDFTQHCLSSYLQKLVDIDGEKL